MTPDAPIAVMDGNCTLCSFGARLVHRLDKSGDIKICRIQIELGRALLKQHGLDPIDPESWLFIEDGTVFRDFEAVIRIGERSGGFGRMLRLLRIIPRPIRNWIYRRIARNRYRLFGRRDMCAVPDAAFRARLIA